MSDITALENEVHMTLDFTLYKPSDWVTKANQSLVMNSGGHFSEFWVTRKGQNNSYYTIISSSTRNLRPFFRRQ